MDLEEFPPKLLMMERFDCIEVQELIDKQRRENATDMFFQLAMDRQQERLDQRVAKLEKVIEQVAANN